MYLFSIKNFVSVLNNAFLKLFKRGIIYNLSKRMCLQRRDIMKIAYTLHLFVVIKSLQQIEVFKDYCLYS